MNSFPQTQASRARQPCDYPVVDHSALIDPTAIIGPETELASIPKVTTDASEFSEDVARTNNDLVQGYKRIAGEL